jgi:outer membrane receptor for ferrienterochelin and colicin
LKPKIKISEKANTVIYFAKIKNQLQPSFYLCDIMAQWKVGNFVRLTVTGHNLLNNKIFSDKEYGLYEYSEQQYVLATRYVILGFQLDF